MTSTCSEDEALRSNLSNSNKYLEFILQDKNRGKKVKTLFLFSTAIAVAGIIVLTLGIVFLKRVSTSSPSSSSRSTGFKTPESIDGCEISQEMKASGIFFSFYL
mgnify:CR=1 FL=1